MTTDTTQPESLPRTIRLYALLGTPGLLGVSTTCTIAIMPELNV